MNYLPRLALNHNPPDFCFLSSWDYRCEPLAPGPLYLSAYVGVVFFLFFCVLLICVASLEYICSYENVNKYEERYIKRIHSQLSGERPVVEPAMLVEETNIRQIIT
jgi:hypothetical protein